jgi:predicted nucleic acid-binding protein
MTFADIAMGAAVFVDANTFVYHFIADPTFGTACTSLLERVEKKEIEATTSPHILAEVAHRLMTIEACQKFGWTYAGIASRLQKHPQNLQQLVAFQQAITEVGRLGLNVLMVTPQHVEQATDISRQHGLLTNDAIVIALMQSGKLVNLASADADFDRVPTLTRFNPI